MLYGTTFLFYSHMKNKTLNATVDVKQDHFQIDEKFAVVFQQRTWTTNDSELLQLLPASFSECKIINTKDLEDFYADKKVQSLPIVLALQNELEVARTQGFHNFAALVRDNTEQLTSKPFECFERLKSMPDLKRHLVWEDHGGHQLRDLDDQYLPVATYFSYIENHISEGTHDLKKIIRLFDFRNDIVIVDENKIKTKSKQLHEALSAGMDISATPGQEIFEIPYYNSEEDRTQSVQFLWIPRTEDFQKIMGTYTGKYKNISRMAIEQDVFGLSSCELGSSKRFKM